MDLTTILTPDNLASAKSGSIQGAILTALVICFAFFKWFISHKDEKPLTSSQVGLLIQNEHGKLKAELAPLVTAQDVIKNDLSDMTQNSARISEHLGQIAVIVGLKITPEIDISLDGK